jgi:hypothetical protein
MTVMPFDLHKHSKEHAGNSTDPITVSAIYSYYLDDSKTPGGIKVRWKVRVVTGPEAARYDARQAEAIRELLQIGADPHHPPMTRTPATGTAPAEPVPVAFLGRTSTLLLQDPVASLRRQYRSVQEKLPPGWFIAAHFWDIESGGLDLEARGHGTDHEQVNVDIPRDGGWQRCWPKLPCPRPGSPPSCARTSNAQPAIPSAL